ncbi:hypothetical protein B7494_g2619 [Chlorociboria aeruginascens]|nr:hypothetical protein B7494_g2619 [Chlorociboria aeruginascens]
MKPSQLQLPSSHARDRETETEVDSTCFDMRSDVGKLLRDTEYAYTISVLYTIYSLPNIVLPFIGGFIAEKYGTGTSNEPRYSRLLTTDEYAEERHEMSVMELDGCEARIGDFQTEVTDDTDLVIIGYGIGTSLINLSLTVVPMVLAGSETWAGYFGIEVVFVGLAGIGTIAAIRLKSP